MAAWVANIPSRSASSSVNRSPEGRSSTSRTPSVRSPDTSGTAMIAFGTYPVDSAACEANRGSAETSSSTSD